ncbi:uncharacterized protein LOC9646786 [Selaginella moellendorffii]|uniref:uncharacterized protein LOC9646786 n=1 Tax=Selaginella moellendorffii TaxID=88036 RepID=UPI000D1CD496|nr:uncharacterized protein LOC9646786 [Selaginella moellendorffii]|eukprot:XP_024519591.1 uncharacterized protein LOC9646786 [Selaginella moellendorffii]
MGLVLLLLLTLTGVIQALAAYSDVFRHASAPQFHHGAFQDISDSIRFDVHRFLHSRAEVPFEVPLEVNVVLLGFNGDGGYRYTLDAVKLKNVLNQSIPRHRPACLETGQRLDIEHKLYYNVIPAGQIELLTVESHLKGAMVATNSTARETEFGKVLPLYEVEATKVEPLFDRLYSYLFGVEPDANTSTHKHLPVAIFILNLDKVRMDPRIPVDVNNATLSSKIEGLTPEQLREQEGGYIYKYRYNEGASTQLWLSSGRYAVIDIAAGPCAYGKVDSNEGSVGYNTVPRLQSVFFPRGRSPIQDTKAHSVFSGQLVALVASAVEYLISPDVRYETVDVAQRLLVSVIILRNHQQNTLLHSGGNDTIDMDAIEREVKKLAEPGQEVVVVGGTHNLHDHEKLAIAVRKAYRSLSTHETTKDGRYQVRIKPYLDGSVLREEFKLSADLLASGLLELAEPSLSNKFFNYMEGEPDEDQFKRDPVIKSSSRQDWRYGSKQDKENKRAESRLQNPPNVKKAYGTRVVPVFVLSLAGLDEELLMQGESAVWTSNDAVFVVQHESDPFNLSYVSETARIQAVPKNPQRHIIAGLAAVVGGLVAPYERASHVHQRPLVNWLWGSGHHPFGPFSNAAKISSLQSDTALRNSIYARVDQALRAIRQSTESIQSFTNEFLKTPLGEPVKGKKPQSVAGLWLDKFYKKTTNLPMPIPHELVQQLETYLDELETQLVEVSSRLYNHELLEAHENSTHLLQYTTFAKAYVEHVLETERDRMRCCHVEHSIPVQSSQALIYGVILLTGFVIYFLVISLSGDKW